MKKKLLLATHNQAKITEFTQLLSELPLELVTLSELNITEEVEEDGQTYLENSQKKALLYAQKSGLPSLADDGGIEIVALDYHPGVNSRRWVEEKGEKVRDEQIIAHMQKIAQNLPDDNRTAFFRTVISFAVPGGAIWSGKGSVKGIIAKKPSFNTFTGFPYRSFFFLPELNKFYFKNELTDEEMKHYNHRHIAFEKLKPVLKEKMSLSYR